ncbi:MAG: hypothetical protein ABIJ43_04815 [Candidatus Beckwithbacteria bacterium]
MKNWIPKDLKLEVNKVFEPRYGRKLLEDEITDIANSLVLLVEGYSKFRWIKDYGQPKSKRILN